MSEKIKIHYIIPIGKDCKIGKFLKTNQLKKTSYPFDWLYTETDQKAIVLILNDDFKEFLNQDNHYKIEEKTSGNKMYDKNYAMFRHHDITSEESLNYYKRCVLRFLEIQKIDCPKLYIIDVDELENIKEIINYIKERSINFYIYVIGNCKKYKELIETNIKVGHIIFTLDIYDFDLVENTNLIINERTNKCDRFDRPIK